MAVLLLAGCAAPADDEPAPASSVTTFTDPSQGRDAVTSTTHLHDYWGSSDRKVVVDTTVPVGTLSLGPGGEARVIVRPEAGAVVPQGAARVEVTMAWTPSPEMGAANQVAATRLAVRTAADREAQEAGPIANGETIALASTNGQNDLPHQVLSAWEFHWIAEPLAVGPLSLVSYQGELTVRVEAVRGLEIPLYPGHPDQWNGASEIELFRAEGLVVMDGDLREDNYRCYGPCPRILVPGDGIVVPIDASHIRVVLDRDAPSPTRLGLSYHTAISRDWVMAEPLEETPTHRVYVIDVLDGGDGAYAKQSSWEFALVVEQPVENGYVADTYHVAASVHRQP